MLPRNDVMAFRGEGERLNEAHV
ncbi:protein of unknown function [Methylocella tundrae]|uniref:Uncharacterized protein n=1 Tax=Methylocella tundrae TaxID=227605 RepID=A0A4V6IMZ9_METTU|nr:protein of unknown function [Methylocella tundrae]